ncbi:unnamed protein product [Candidula unifasciata]|uniref:Uncharacterized protein n=1 Tax=Candidula unifasciata TaxID=100452 RepID=A0A8S3ZXA4_9EUPU|nr:unnamed protein product [Candidula unifasciata]
MTQAKHAVFRLTFPVLLLASLTMAATGAVVGSSSVNFKTGSSVDKLESPNRFKRMSDISQQGQDYASDHVPRMSGLSEITNLEPEYEKYLNADDVLDKLSGLYSLSTDEMNSEAAGNSKRASQFMRIGRGPSSFVRIGKSEINGDDNIDKRASSFVRIGKAPSSFVRIGKAPSSFVRIGKAPSSFVRIGKAPSSFVRIGKAPSSFVRIGRAPSSFVRIGKSDTSFDENDLNTYYEQESDNFDKRASSFVRIGKAPSSFVRIGKAPSSFVRIGKSALAANLDDQLESESNEKEKKASSFVRIGKSKFDNEINDAKRASSFVRIGKSDMKSDQNSDSQKRASSFVRIGKSWPSDSQNSELLSPLDASVKASESLLSGSVGDKEPIKVETRGSAFVRIGKIPSSAFVRIGKNDGLLIDEAEGTRNTRGSHSSFVRIGK